MSTDIIEQHSPNSLTFYFENERLPNPRHLARRLHTLSFRSENIQNGNKFMEYVPDNTEFLTIQKELEQILIDIQYLRCYCKQRGLFLKSITFNTKHILIPSAEYLIKKYCNETKSFFTQMWTQIHENISAITGYNISFKDDPDISGSD